MITTVSQKGQVTIPEALRARYGFPLGTKVVWLERPRNRSSSSRCSRSSSCVGASRGAR